MKKIAVIDTETNWYDQVMSVGVAIAEADSWNMTGTRYYIITPECTKGGMYSSVMEYKGVQTDLKGSRNAVMQNIRKVLFSEGITDIFAYNASFDCKHMPEFADFAWYDIMKLAAYRQYNPGIPEDAECCKTGRLKYGYGVESVMHMLTGNCSYHEVHNALCDAVDELRIVKLLGHGFDMYQKARIN